jgi:hypothetical protein
MRNETLFVFNLLYLKFVANYLKMHQKSIDKNLLKSVLEDMLKERNPELQGFLEELLAKFLSSSSDKKVPLNMTEIRHKYALQRDAFRPLQELFEDTPPAYELTQRLSK